ncbi:hypothetical protein EBESD8_3070 [Rhodococcus aetherivorans]|nr:hypothetical protein EBESD8_3070 [Rhodococcus aetherivorans]
MKTRGAHRLGHDPLILLCGGSQGRPYSRRMRRCACLCRGSPRRVASAHGG